ncbi:MAG TPA: LysR family transcriptional regulator [Vicinamibacterales bacterium]|nr:LysR family transcriptional regulator [Vicinamibacterales bacterium]
MDLRQLEILQAIAETGSFTGSGRKLHVSQSAISRQILLLEEELNEPLFLRIGRQVKMTPAGEALLQMSHRIFQDLKDTVGALTDRTGELRGTLRLAGGMTVCIYVFPPLLRHFHRVHRHADVRVSAGLTEKSIRELRAGTIDCGLLTLPIDEPDLVTIPVLKEELLLVTAVNHPLSRRRRIAPADLADQPFVLFEVGSNTRRVIEAFFLRAKIEPTIVMDTENVEIIKAMVRAGLGISILPYLAVAREVHSRQFFCARIQDEQLVRQTGWVYPRTNRVPRMVQEALRSFEAIRGQLRLSPPPGRFRPRVAAAPAGAARHKA